MDGSTRRETPVAAPPRAYTSIRLSPDETKAAVEIRDRQPDIWIVDFKRRDTALRRLTFDRGQEPLWSANGTFVLFSSSRSGAANLYRRFADGRGTDERLTTSEYPQFAGTMTPDGHGIGMEVLSTQYLALLTPRSPAAVPSDQAPSAIDVVRTAVAGLYPRLSPNGRFLAYQASEGGGFEIYVKRAQRRNARASFAMDAVVVEQRVAVRDTVAKSGRCPKRARGVACDRRSVGEQVERRCRVVRFAPAFIGHPVSRKIDAFLNSQEQVEESEIALLDVGTEHLDRAGERHLGVVQQERARAISVTTISRVTTKGLFAQPPRHRVVHHAHRRRPVPPVDHGLGPKARPGVRIAGDEHEPIAGDLPPQQWRRVVEREDADLASRGTPEPDLQVERWLDARSPSDGHVEIAARAGLSASRRPEQHGQLDAGHRGERLRQNSDDRHDVILSPRRRPEPVDNGSAKAGRPFEGIPWARTACAAHSSQCYGRSHEMSDDA